MPRFVQADHDQQLLLPPNIREWIPENDLAHFILEAVDRVPLNTFKVNDRGTGSEQYSPHLMLALLVYCYANGIFSSRKIERATYRDIGVRFITADTHPDHDTICRFRRENAQAISEAFLQVLEIAKELKLLRVGTVSVDGTKMRANANKRRGLRYDRAQELRAQLQEEIAELMEEAERADRSGESDGQSLPKELANRQKLKRNLDAACAKLEREAKKRQAKEEARIEREMGVNSATGGKQDKGSRNDPPDPPKPATVEPSQQINLTDSDSALMRKNNRSEYQQCYNPQAAVDAGGSQLVLATRIAQNGSDRNELVAGVEAIAEDVGNPTTVLADAAYASGTQVTELENRGVNVLVAIGSGDRRRKYDFRPQVPPKPAKKVKAAWRIDMQEKMALESNRALYRLRQQTVEPVFGIMKHAMGFRQFHLRGREKVSTEWRLLALAYNCKRLHNMMEA